MGTSTGQTQMKGASVAALLSLMSWNILPAGLSSGQWQCGYEYGNNSGGYFSSLPNEALANGLPDSISTLPSIKLKGKIMTINQ